MTDTAGYSDQVFGLFRLLGYQFSPRLADIGAGQPRTGTVRASELLRVLQGGGRPTPLGRAVARTWSDSQDPLPARLLGLHG